VIAQYQEAVKHGGLAAQDVPDFTLTYLHPWMERAERERDGHRPYSFAVGNLLNG